MSLRTLRPAVSTPVGLVVVALLVLAGLNAGQLPLINPSRDAYQALFTDASGLQPSDSVEVAGVVVGRVTSTSVKDGAVLVRFTVDRGIRVGGESTAAIKLGNLLGSKYLEVVPAGRGRIAESAPIPLSRTRPAYDVTAAFADLTTVEKGLDNSAIVHSFDVLAQTFQDAPAQVQGAIQGLSDLSHSISSRDGEIRDLVSHAASTTAVLDQRSADIVQILSATNLVLQALQQRKQVIDQLLKNTVSLASELQGLVAENRPALTNALKQLATVTAMLEQHQGDISSTIANMGQYISTFDNVVGNGPWFDVVIPRLPNSVSVEKR